MRMVMTHPIDEFPAVVALLQACHCALGLPEGLHLGCLNVIVRRYDKRRGCIPFHKDRDWFEEVVLGCVLSTARANHGLGLQFSPPGKSTGRGFRVPGSSGVTFVQTGAARYQWPHGAGEVAGE